MAESSTNDLEENILAAAEKGQLSIVQKFLESGVDPNTIDDVGTSALHNAAKEGHWDIVRLLLEKKASPRLQDGHNLTPLHKAVQSGHSKIVRLILDCDPTICESMTYPLRLLCFAARRGHSEIVQMLLDHNVPTIDKGPELTPLHYAAENGHHEVCDILLKHDKALERSLWERMTGPSLEVHKKDWNGATPIVYAFEKKHHQAVGVFLRHYPQLTKARDGHRDKSLLFLKAARMRNIEMVRVFLDNGADIEMKDDQGRRALHMVVDAINLFESSYFDETVELIQFLLARGAIVDAKDNEGWTPEFQAQNPKIRMLLRNHKASKGDAIAAVPHGSAPPPEYKE